VAAGVSALFGLHLLPSSDALHVVALTAYSPVETEQRQP